MRLFCLFSILFCYTALSATYFTGDAWRASTDHRLTESEKFDPKKVGKGDTIFVECHLLRTFRKMARKIKEPFILITPNVDGFSDMPLPGAHEKLLKIKNLAAWFTQNLDRPQNERLIAIPIGLSNSFSTRGTLETLEKKEKTILCYVNFNVATNVEKRKPCMDYFLRKPWAQWAKTKPFQNYLEDLSQSVFTISPPGNGLDCHRTWEALYLKCYPIVLRTTLTPLYEGLPIIIVDHWDEVTEDFLKRKKEELDASRWNYEKLYLPYWFEKVKALQKKIRLK